MKLDNDGFPKMPGDWLFKIVPIFILVAFLGIVGYWVFVGVVALKAAKTLDECGIPVLVTSNDGHGNQSYTVKCNEKK